MKTIFVTLPIGLSVRNILFTGVLDQLVSRGDVRVVTFTAVPNLVDRYPRPDDHLIFEVFPPRHRRTFPGILNYLLNLRFNYLNDDPALTSIREKRKWLRLNTPRQYLFETALSQPLPKNKTIYKWLSTLYNRLSRAPHSVRSLFDHYRPSLVFATNPTSMREFHFLKHGGTNGITTVGMIHSWDVLTTEGQIVAPLDHYFVWNQVMQRELINIHGVSEEKISVTGIPQFDVYADPASPNSREVFLREQGLDPGKSTVLFATSAGGLTPDEPETLAGLVSALNKECPGRVQFLVRIHQQDNIGRYAFISDPKVKFQIPGTPMRHLDDWRLMDDGDLRLLRDTLAYSDVVVNTASTISIDAIALDRPVVNIAFDLHEKDYHRSVRRYFRMIHLQHVVKSGATKLADSLDELVSHVQRYLDNPEFEREQRISLTEAMCDRVDGKSADRVASFLLDALDGKIIRDVGITTR